MTLILLFFPSLFQVFVPLTPRILSLTPDFSTSTLNLKWSDNGLIFPYGLDAFWQIQILRKEATEKVTQVGPFLSLLKMYTYFLPLVIL